MEILKLEHVKKNFGGLPVIQDLSFSVSESSVFGLIGKNGAGKTTTMKMLLGFLKSDAGEIKVCGEKVAYGDTKTNRHVGYLPDVPEFYSYMTPVEYLRLCGEISGQKPRPIRKKTEELLALVGLENSNRKISGFSRGMKQRLGIAQALMNEPRLLICDEPTSALDPVGRKEILDILSIAGKQTAILISTHILSDVERLCDHIGILDDGKLVLQGKLSDIKNSYRHSSLRIALADQDSAAVLAGKLANLPFVSAVEAKENSLTVRLEDMATEGLKILELLLREQVFVLKYEVLEPSLEDVFLEVIQ
ncbi:MULTISPECIES: ABC transporter ATP-binding protein [Dehalobacter]|jgi:ABC-2 type transport system ATP-binding protein|uniref:ATP-binding cassette domain-containing protein n=2 Tax=Dehalobacter restrictus TaxID=55583 RepID=A0A857DJ03_9FIRM|nr:MULTISPECIES: ABC transporter ATP-binding protein [Dehalobacter]AHF10099.1 ABC transporter ATP-binding protein [Dehalobacter restrictus DSM 9455]MCG1025314.1 ABC transporter ATP-binding protein [Dehalobacter sp.]MDJ0306157.1 ABC transporter ATP-binding protein [Dehalobacter sp.]OCZ52004.1 ABC transporter ATP-binding protein [Dehalobacter sp. TeCB1]QHA00701.1 ATP-binding cassette domain-containing protein [Dehalobacter restrictus]